MPRSFVTHPKPPEVSPSIKITVSLCIHYFYGLYGMPLKFHSKFSGKNGGWLSQLRSNFLTICLMTTFWQFEALVGRMSGCFTLKLPTVPSVKKRVVFIASLISRKTYSQNANKIASNHFTVQSTNCFIYINLHLYQ